MDPRRGNPARNGRAEGKGVNLQMAKLVIVESPSKAKTIQKYLGSEYEVMASMGHVRDLPKARLSVDVKDHFKPKYSIIKGKEKLVKELKEAAANADGVLLATDPDCDRVGIAVKNKAGKYELLTGNQTGMLLLDYICCQRVKHGKMPTDPVMIKTIVTMDMGEQIATHYGLRTINVLTGFKFIGEQIGKLEKQGRADSYVFGFEESYGYLTGSYVRDKDGVDGAYMICEMFSYYATKGISLLDKLDELYKTYGYCLNTLHSYEFDGSAGFAKMQSIMQAFRGNIKAFGGKKVVKLLDYAYGLDGLPKSDVLKFLLEDNCSIVVRPSGTEPKLKIYISVCAENREAAEKVECEIVKDAENWFA